MMEQQLGNQGLHALAQWQSKDPKGPKEPKKAQKSPKRPKNAQKDPKGPKRGPKRAQMTSQ